MDLFPKTFESWVFLIVACAIGLFMGQWIRHRRNKSEAEREALNRMVNTPQRKRVSKKERRREKVQ
jgi:hypothetical protein